MRPFNYSDYESQLMDQDYIRMLQGPRVRFFKDCKKVLDLGSGPGPRDEKDLTFCEA